MRSKDEMKKTLVNLSNINKTIVLLFIVNTRTGFKNNDREFYIFINDIVDYLLENKDKACLEFSKDYQLEKGFRKLKHISVYESILKLSLPSKFYLTTSSPEDGQLYVFPDYYETK
jgi:hypothetical protein